jgi:hypothetical protein
VRGTADAGGACGVAAWWCGARPRVRAGCGGM